MKKPIEIKDIADFSYITSRKLKNENGEEKGTVFLWREKGDEEFNYKLKCPYCEEEQESSVVFNRRPYRLKCSFKTLLIFFASFFLPCTSNNLFAISNSFFASPFLPTCDSRAARLL